MNNKRLTGVALIVLGALFLLSEVGGVRFHIWELWPLLPMAAGVVSISSGNRKGGLIVIAIFSSFLLHNLGFLTINFSVLWPVALIAIGLAIVSDLRPFRTARTADAGEDLNVESVFSESSQNAAGSGFRGGNVSATFGSAEVDLRSADIADGAATVNASVLFGSISLRVPQDWAVDIQSSVMFGNIESKRPEPDEPKARLVVTGNCWFGEIKVTS